MILLDEGESKPVFTHLEVSCLEPELGKDLFFVGVEYQIGTPYLYEIIMKILALTLIMRDKN